MGIREGIIVRRWIVRLWSFLSGSQDWVREENDKKKWILKIKILNMGNFIKVDWFMFKDMNRGG